MRIVVDISVIVMIAFGVPAATVIETISVSGAAILFFTVLCVVIMEPESVIVVIG